MVSSDFERHRLAVLACYQSPGTQREKAFDEIVELAAAICRAPIAAIILIGDAAQFVEAEVGLDVQDGPVLSSACAERLLEKDFLQMADASPEPQLSRSPLTANLPSQHFHAGAQPKTPDGFPVDTLCVLDVMPRQLDETQILALKVLAYQCMSAFELRRIANGPMTVQPFGRAASPGIVIRSRLRNREAAAKRSAIPSVAYR